MYFRKQKIISRNDIDFSELYILHFLIMASDEYSVSECQEINKMLHLSNMIMN